MKFTYDDKSFLLDDRRIWIVGAEIHYFRHPRAEWRDALLRAKRAGINTICTYVPWNFHELTEGNADFEGDKDLGAYIELIGEMGLYAMLRPGPYICSEWDGGGIPAWLCAKPVLRFREDDPVYMAAVESWFDQLIPIISERQITRGGPVITVQNENEYPGGWDASMRRYIDRINEIFKKHGIDVPVLACNVHGESATTVKINDSTDACDQVLDPGMILTYNHHVDVEPVYDLKRKQPNAPLITTEFWCGAPIYWGNPVTDWPNRLPLARAVYEYTSSGTQVCYYMFDGGTNFGFWGGNNIATSYASGYPVGEGGLLTDKYYAVRPANLFLQSFGGDIAGTGERADRGGIQAGDDVRLIVREGERGAYAFLSTASRRRELPIMLPHGKELTVHLGEVSAAVLPLHLELFGDAVVDYANLTLLAKCDASRTLILYGPAGTEGIVSLNGQELSIPVNRRAVQDREADGVRILVADEEMARRCWIADNGRIVFGPDYAGKETADGELDVNVSDASPDVVTLDEQGKPAAVRIVHSPKKVDLPELGAWHMFPCPELGVHADDEGWQPIGRPLSHESLGVVQGYLWYAAELECDADGVRTLLLTHATNRISVFVNGRFCGVHAEGRSVRMRDEYAHPADWAFEELTITVKKGTNRIVFLSDDLGHNYDVPVPVGIQGPVFAGIRRVEVDGLRAVDPSPVSADAFNFLYNRFYREPAPLPAVEFELNIGGGERAFIMIHGVKAWVSVNGKEIPPMSYPESPWTMFSQIKRWISWQLPDTLTGTVTVRVQYFDESPNAVSENMAVYIAPASGELTNWRWKRWEADGDFTAAHAVDGQEAGEEGLVVLLPAGHRLKRKVRALAPAYFEAHFPMPEGDRPVYLDIGELQKGQIYLNGHNAGRFWAYGGTQQRYYLPRSWMQAENRLVVFEELGCHPQNASLVYGESGDWTTVTLARQTIASKG